MTLYIFSLLILILSSCSINYVDSFSSTPGSAIISITSRSIPTKRCSSSRAPTTRLLMSAGEAALPMPLEEEGRFLCAICIYQGVFLFATKSDGMHGFVFLSAHIYINCNEESVDIV